MRLSATTFSLLAVLLLGSVPAYANTITFTNTGNGSGTLTNSNGTTQFTDADFVITLVGDTSSRIDLGNDAGWTIPAITASISISGFGDLQFVPPVEVAFSYQGGGVSIGRSDNHQTLYFGADIYTDAVGYPCFSYNGQMPPPVGCSCYWDMTTSIGPLRAQLSGPEDIVAFGTNLGTLFFTDLNYYLDPTHYWNTNTVFQAVVSMEGSSVIPEPSSLALLGIGLVGVIGYGWRHGRG